MGCVALIETFWFNICHSKRLHFWDQKRDRLIFDDFHEVSLMVFDDVFLVPKKLSKDVRKVVSDQNDVLALFW